MTDAIYPQVRIVPMRLINPERVERLLNVIVATEGVRRMVLNGPSLPPVVPYGPARGAPNPHEMRKKIMVGEQEIELQVHVGTIILELENMDVIPAIKAACDLVFSDLTYQLKEGRFMKTEASLTDYAKYGPDADKTMIGLSDPKSRSGPVILQGNK
jgi:methyl-coenzyme M reductase subunit D